jgi:hypothetical protein
MKRKTTKKLPPLSQKREEFIEAYLKLQNGGQAYKSVYAKTKPMSDNVARVNASQLLTFPNVREAIAERKRQIEALNPVCTVEELAEGWSDDIRLDLGELVDENGTFKSPKDLSPKVRRLIQGVKIKESIVEVEGGAGTVLNRWIEYKLPDRQKARVELGKRVDFYPAEKVEHSGVITTKLELTDQDREMAQKLIDAAARALMESEVDKSS